MTGRRFSQPMTGKYTIERCTPVGSYNGIEGVLDSDDDLATAQHLYRAANNPGRIVLLCQSVANTLARFSLHGLMGLTPVALSPRAINDRDTNCGR